MTNEQPVLKKVTSLDWSLVNLGHIHTEIESGPSSVTSDMDQINMSKPEMVNEWMNEYYFFRYEKRIFTTK